MILVDGERHDSVPATDRGLAYGDGLFETLRAYRGGLPLLDRHLERLAHGLDRLRIPHIPESLLRAELVEAANAARDGVVKLMVTRGSGGRGYRPSANMQPRRIVQAMPAPEHVERWRHEGVSLRVCETRLAGPPMLDGVKHLNRLSQVLARAEWGDEFDEGLMRDADGHLVDGTSSNFLVVREGAVLAPPVGAGVQGVMRGLVLELARDAGVETAERVLSDQEIETADEIFITNSVIGVCPVRRFALRDLALGTIARRLQAAVNEELDRLA